MKERYFGHFGRRWPAAKPPTGVTLIRGFKSQAVGWRNINPRWRLTDRFGQVRDQNPIVLAESPI
jgi:hypothetical protein